MEAIKTEVHPLDDTEHDESEESSPKTMSKPKVKMFDLEIVEGKREKKVIQRLDMMSKPKEKPKIESKGKGDKLGDIARINHSIGKLKAPLLKPLHKILYDRPGAASTLRKNLRLFNGFPFKEDSDLYNKKMEKVKRLPKKLLKTICQTLDLERSGTQVVLSERIMKFLAQPTNSGKPVLKKKRKTTKDGKKEKSSSKSRKQQKKVVSGKSKPIVTDSSSDDDDDDDDDGDEEKSKGKSKGTEKSAKASQKHDDSEDKSDEEDESSDDDDDDDDNDDDSKEDSKEETSPSQKKSSTGKSPKKSEKKSDQSPSDETTDDSDLYCEDKDAKKTKKKPAAKRKAPAKPVPKTKKADSSSNRKKKTASKRKDESESSDDDQPLIKMIKKPPTDEQLKENVKDLLKDANLEEVTMKQITRQVYDMYPDFDLSSRKELIRETVKNMIS
ncbi:protein DEK isoform X2 [Danio aesculapii]|uniref:protein DEK isoform X2 n=1 Tax=Danio aesculapii TaxID=1142201 RepID=UPI0024BFE207|nr:protein DEK isoform X2 [Danio aesculapii]